MEGAAGLRWGRNRESRSSQNPLTSAGLSFPAGQRGSVNRSALPNRSLTHSGLSFCRRPPGLGVPAWKRRALESGLPSTPKGAGIPTAPPSLGPESRD